MNRMSQTSLQMGSQEKELLLSFLLVWYDWAERNKNNAFPEPFYCFAATGLCMAFGQWLRRTTQLTEEQIIECHEFLAQEFKRTGVFIPGGDHFKWYESDLRIPPHQWEPRVKWVKDYLLENQNND